MKTSRTAHALIVAGGTSQRFGSEVPKLYHLIEGRPVLWYTLRAFASHPQIERIVLVHHADHLPWLAPILEDYPEVECVLGGAERQDSVREGGEAFLKHASGSMMHEAAKTKILIHDAARPWVSAGVISRVIAGLEQADAVYPCVKLADTIRTADGTLLDRDQLRAAQTPQGFDLAAITRLHAENKAAVTDDIALAQAAGIEVLAVEGDVANKKVTVRGDLFSHSPLVGESKSEAIRWGGDPPAFALPPNPPAPNLAAPQEGGDIRVGHGIDVHAFIDHPAGAEETIKICGISVACSKAIEGHSDGDVGLHALTDAILGAICGGDIGQLFPSESSEWAGADSAIFLAEAARRMQQAGASLIHADITLIAQMPKLSPHRDSMRQRVAEILAVDVSRISVKATTTDYLGFTGRKEGLAAMATVSVLG